MTSPEPVPTPSREPQPAASSPAAAKAPPAEHGYRPWLWNLSKYLVLAWAKIWLRHRVEGREHFPRQGPVLIAANHASYLDPPLLGISSPRFVHFLAQSGLAKAAPLRWWLRNVGVSLIDRRAPSKDVLRLLSRSLERGVAVAIFPEGTRSTDGNVAPFRTGVEFLARRTGAMVLPTGIEGSFASFPRGGKFPQPRRCTVRFGAPWAAERVLAPGGMELLRQEIARLANTGLGTPTALPDTLPDGSTGGSGVGSVSSNPGSGAASADARDPSTPSSVRDEA